MLKYQKVKARILNDIISMSPGDRIEGRAFLAGKYSTTRATLDKAIKELENEGYLSSRLGSGTFVTSMPNAVPQQIQTWGVIVPNVMEEIYPGIIRGAENYANVNGINIILCNSDNDFGKQELYLRRLVASGISGMILVPVIITNLNDNLRLYRQLLDTNVPFVFCNRSIDGIDVPVVVSNDSYGGYIATKHLLENGYTSPAYVAKIRYKTSNDRCQGFISAVAEHNIEVNRDAIIFNDFDKVEKLIKSREIDSIFCFDDSIAERCYSIIQGNGLRIPQDIGIIAYNNTSICEALDPTLSSVAFKNVEIGEKAAEVLMSIIRKEIMYQYDSYLFQPSLSIRESSIRTR